VLRARALAVPAFLLFVLLAAGCGDSSDPLSETDSDPRVVAEAADLAVTVTWFEQTYIDFLIRSGSNDTPENRLAHLDQLIDSILLAEAFEERGYADAPEFEAARRRIEREELGSRYFEEALLDTMQAPTEAQIRETFRRFKSEAVVRHLFFVSPDQAQESWERLEDGATFVEEARRIYDLPELDSTAGYLGAVRYFAVDDAFAEAAWTLEPGTYSKPVRSRYGWHIIYLERMITEPLLTESEFQTRRQGMSSQYRLRRRRLEGDNFVRAFMTERNVEVNAPAIRALEALIRDLDPPPEGDPEIIPRTEPSLTEGDLRRELDADVVLATYEWDGERRAFKAGDYAFWFESLPTREARERTGASVGRAMRNELLAEAGAEHGLRDAEWEVDVERRIALEEARRMRQRLRSEPVEVDTALVKQAFERLRLAERRSLRVSFDAALFGTAAEARRAAEAGPAWTISVRDSLLADLPDWNPAVSRAPIDSIVVVGRRADWAVLRVLGRTRVPLTWRDHREELEERLTPFVREYRMVRDLRGDAAIRIDTTLFREITEIENR